MVTEVLLRDGTPAMIWTMSPTDGVGLAEYYKGLSAESRYNRFLSPVANLSEGMLRHLVDDVDGLDHNALILAVFPDNADESEVAVGRLVRYREDPTTADIAVTVKDDWQGRGVATALLRELIAERPAGVDKILTYVTFKNVASLAMLRRLGTMTTAPAGENILEVRIDLPPSQKPSQK